jgi:hypothetical protein
VSQNCWGDRPQCGAIQWQALECGGRTKQRRVMLPATLHLRRLHIFQLVKTQRGAVDKQLGDRRALVCKVVVARRASSKGATQACSVRRCRRWAQCRSCSVRRRSCPRDRRHFAMVERWMLARQRRLDAYANRLHTVRLAPSGTHLPLGRRR